MSNWFPDFVAQWYDKFSPKAYGDAKIWRGQVRPNYVKKGIIQMKKEPHQTAFNLNSVIESTNSHNLTSERWVEDWYNDIAKLRLEEKVYRALQIASDTLREINLSEYSPNYSNEGNNLWSEMRLYWLKNKNLLKKEKGILFPTRQVDFAWAPDREIKDSVPQSHFRNIIRLEEISEFQVEHILLPSLDKPIPSLSKKLRVAAIPLIESIDDFEWESTNGLSNKEGKFRVFLKDPQKITLAAQEAIEQAGEKKCDLVIFPELCLTPEGQMELSNTFKRVSGKNSGHPWLLIAGSAYTPVEDKDKPNSFHNRSVVFYKNGNKIFHYNKLYEYKISREEQDRYSLPIAMNKVAKVEDIICVPRILSVLDTLIGRIAVIICEDFSISQFVQIIIDKLQVDWLIVPVLDGVQAKGRWTARRASRYAEDGASSIVVTSSSLVNVQLENEDKAILPSEGIALSILAHKKEVEIHTKNSKHNIPVIIDFK